MRLPTDEDDLGAPIVCAEYDLEECLLREYTAQMAREDRGPTSDDEDELEEAPLLTASHNVHQQPTAPTGPASALTGLAKKKERNRRRQRAMRKDATLASLESTTPPAPTPRVLQKAAQAVPISIPFAADDFRATKPRWIGLTQPLEHPLLAHYHDTDFLKKHLRYIDWDGKYALRFRWRPLPLTYLAGKRMSSSTDADASSGS